MQADIRNDIPPDTKINQKERPFMELTIRLMKHKYLKAAICFVLCLASLLLTFYVQYQEVYAILPAIVIGGVLIPKAVVIIGSLLAAAGLTCLTVTAAESVSNWYYNELKPAIKTKVINMVSNAIDTYANIAYVEEDVWEDAVGFVNYNYNVGENEMTKNYYNATITSTVGENTYTDYYPVNYGVSGTQLFPVALPVMEDFIIGENTYKIVISDSSGTNKSLEMFKNNVKWWDGINTTVNTAVPFAMYLEVLQVSTTYMVKFRLKYAGYGETQWKGTDASTSYIANALVTPGIPGTSTDVSANGQTVVDTTHDIVMQDGVTRAVKVYDEPADIVNKVKADVTVTSIVTPYSNDWSGTFRDCAPTGEFVFAGSGAATIGYDVTGTWDGVWSTNTDTGAKVWTGTYTDTQSQTWTGTITGQVDDSRTWWQTVIGGINTGIADLGQLLVGTLAQLKAAVEAIAAPIVTAVTDGAAAVSAKVQEVVNSISIVQENTAEADMTQKMRDYRLPDLFILILKVILACIRLILRALIFIATLPVIPADAGDINGDFLSGVNFLKNQTIPFFNVSLWSMVTGIIAIFFGLAVVKRIRRLYSV